MTAKSDTLAAAVRHRHRRRVADIESPQAETRRALRQVDPKAKFPDLQVHLATALMLCMRPGLRLEAAVAEGAFAATGWRRRVIWLQGWCWVLRNHKERAGACAARSLVWLAAAAPPSPANL